MPRLNSPLFHVRLHASCVILRNTLIYTGPLIVMPFVRAIRAKIAIAAVCGALAVLGAVFVSYAARSLRTCVRQDDDPASPGDPHYHPTCDRDRTVALVVGLMFILFSLIAIAVWSTHTRGRISANWLWLRDRISGRVARPGAGEIDLTQDDIEKAMLRSTDSSDPAFTPADSSAFVISNEQTED